MKTVTLCFFLLVIMVAQAHPLISVGEYLPSSDNVLLTQVTSTSPGKVKFRIIETLKGFPRSYLTLIPQSGYSFSQGSNWLLIRSGNYGWKDHVGLLLSGDCEWVPARVIKKNDDLEVEGVGSLINIQEMLKSNIK